MKGIAFYSLKGQFVSTKSNHTYHGDFNPFSSRLHTREEIIYFSGVRATKQKFINKPIDPDFSDVRYVKNAGSARVA
jgi:hypothetical protein